MTGWPSGARRRDDLAGGGPRTGAEAILRSGGDMDLYARPIGEDVADDEVIGAAARARLRAARALHQPGADDDRRGAIGADRRFALRRAPGDEFSKARGADFGASRARRARPGKAVAPGQHDQSRHDDSAHCVGLPG